ncbi:MAG TPA: benzoate-CoA ligase family protein [Pseudonocardiaceae bacterium]
MLRREDIPHRFNLAGHFVDRIVERGRGDRPALITDSAATSYEELAELMNRIGNVLLELGVRRGDRVLLAMSDGVEFVATWYGAQKIGAVTAEVYTYLPVKDYAYFLRYTEASVVVVDAVTLGPIREAADGHCALLVAGDVNAAELRHGEHSLAVLLAQAAPRLEAAPTTADDVAIWKFTTGSTGAPKACVHPAHSPLLSFDWYARGVLGISQDDVVLPVPKLFFGYARDLAALYPFGVGGAGVVFPERSTPERMFDLIERHRPTILVNVPTMMSEMLAHPAAATADLSCLRLCTSAGEALPAELERRWQDAFGIDVVDGIGSSEAYHIFISNRPGAPRRRGSLGPVVPGYTARVVGEDGTPLPDGSVGLLEITGDTVALEYYGAPDKTAATFIGGPDGRTVRSADLFERDADGYFYYRGRADDLLKVSGVWVAPSEIEHCLMGHLDVLECGVVGYEVDGLTRPRAFVVLRDGATVTASELQDLARAQLSPHKYPRDVRFVAALPRTANGKLDRRALSTQKP